MNKFSKICCLLSLVLFSQFACLAADRSIYLVRHAEKQSGGSRDPSLTSQGIERANNIAKMLKKKKIVAIYSSDYERTKQTAAPLAKLLALEVIIYNPGKLRIFAEQLLKTQGNLLIVGHSNTTPNLAFLLGGQAFGDIKETEYDRIYQLRFHAGQVTTQLLNSEPNQQH